MFKRRYCLLALLFLVNTLHAQYWQQTVNYTISVSLNDKDHTLDGSERIQYVNHSPDTLRFIWFHCWPNAFKNDRTAFSEQLLRLGRTDFYFSNRDQRGYINHLDFKVDGKTAATSDHPLYIDIIKLELPEPLAPGATTLITTPFHVQLPYNFSRGGHVGDSYQVTQWFPKPAVYDPRGWHPMPYLDQGEFYSDFGHYEVAITLPGNYVVAATGILQDEQEKEWLQQRRNFQWQPISSKQTIKKGSYKHIVKSVQLYPVSSATTKTLHFVQDQVHDFAWFADKRFIFQQDTVALPSGKIITASSFYLPGSDAWPNSLQWLKTALRGRSALLGDYPYSTMSIVQAPMGAGSGMEYPSITSISPSVKGTELKKTIGHEAGHNWLQSAVASNERDYPWMDEGMNTYYDQRTAAPPTLPPPTRFPGNHLPARPEEWLLQALIARHRDQPVNTTAPAFTPLNYELVPYVKTANWLSLLEQQLGRPLFDSTMRHYVRDWSGKHPYPADFRASIESSTGRSLASFFALADSTGPLPPVPHRPLKPTAFFNVAHTDQFNYINCAPALGFNSYDKMMVGVLVHNYEWPVNRFQFLAAPLYATGSKQFNYLGRLSYDWYPKKFLFKLEAGISLSAFSMDSYSPAPGENIFLRFRKIAPYLRFTFKQADPLSTTRRYLQFTPYVITESRFNFTTVIHGPDTTSVVLTPSSTRYLNQLKFVLDNNRALYPYALQVQLEQADGFLRAAVDARYYLNYPNGKSGLSMRFFAGKFLYTTPKTLTKAFETDRYQLNLTGANGYEDYTYSNYFIGRNEFDGFGSHQLMMRDGGFKVRTDLLSNKIGKTDNWLAAINLSTDIYDKKFPIKVFADIGTYSNAWEANAPTSRVLFDAGLQLSLLHQSVNIYLPLLYSNVYRDYFRSTIGSNYLFKTIAFSIDLQNLKPEKINRLLDF